MASQRYISDTLKQKKKKVRTLKAYLLTLLILAIIGGVLYSTRIPQIQISDVQVTGNAFVSTQEIQDKTHAILNRQYLGFIPNTNIFIFSKSELAAYLKQNPAIVAVKIHKSYFDTLNIEITEQAKEMIYCATPEHTDCFYINKAGFIYAKIPDFIIPEQEVIMYNEAGFKNIQDTILEEKLYIDVVTFIKSSMRYDIRIGQVHLKADGLIEFVTRDQTRLITSIYDDFAKDFDNLVVLFEKSVLTKEQLPTVDYIDLRFGNKVFYKNKTN